MERKTNDGGYLQDELAKVMGHYTQYNPGFFHRFPDTKSAGGNFLKAQPGDYMLLLPVQCLLIECKSTVAGAKLITLAHHGKVGKVQVAKHRLWHRAGHRSLYLYGDLEKRRYEWHSGQMVVRKVTQPLVTGDMSTLKDSIPLILRRIMELNHVASI